MRKRSKSSVSKNIYPVRDRNTINRIKFIPIVFGVLREKPQGSTITKLSTWCPYRNAYAAAWYLEAFTSIKSLLRVEILLNPKKFYQQYNRDMHTGEMYTRNLA